VNENDFESFVEILVGLAEIRGRELSKPAIKIFFRAMQHWEIGLFRQVAEHLLRTTDRFPQPSDFENLRSAWLNTTAEAWSRALAFSKTCYAPNGHVERAIGDYVIDTAVRCIGGYAAIASCRTDQLHWLEKRFAERLVELQDVVSTRVALPVVAESFRLTTQTATNGLKPISQVLLPRS